VSEVDEIYPDDWRQHTSLIASTQVHGIKC